MTGGEGNSDRTLDAALETVRVALALGAELAAEPGMRFHTATVTIDESYVADLGTFSTYEEALAAVSEWVVHEWDNGFAAPWQELDDHATQDEAQAMDAWLAGKTDQEIVDEYFAGTDDHVYEISEGHVVPGPERTYGPRDPDSI